MVPLPAAPAVPGQWQPGAGWQPSGSSTRPTARRRTIAMLAAVSLALLAVISALAIGHAGPERHSLNLPESAGSYVRLSTLSGDHIRSIFGSNGAFGNIPTADLTKARIGIYGRGAQSAPSALFIGFTATDSPNIGQQLHAEAATEVTSDVLAGAGAPAASRWTRDRWAVRCGAARPTSTDCSPPWASGPTPTPSAWCCCSIPRSARPPRRPGPSTRAFRAQAEH